MLLHTDSATVEALWTLLEMCVVLDFLTPFPLYSFYTSLRRHKWKDGHDAVYLRQGDLVMERLRAGAAS